MPVVPATQEAEVKESLEPRIGGAVSQDPTIALQPWVTKAKQNKKTHKREKKKII